MVYPKDRNHDDVANNNDDDDYDDDDDDDDDTLRRLWDVDSDSDDHHHNNNEGSIMVTHHSNQHHHANDDSYRGFQSTNTDTTITTTTTTTTPAGPLPPPYLMTAILAGLYEIPPRHILQYQTGWGRRIRYHHVQHITTQFQKLEMDFLQQQQPPTTQPTIEYMTLQRYSHFQLDPVASSSLSSSSTDHSPPTRKRATQCHEFNIYRVQLLPSSQINTNTDPDTTTATPTPTIQNVHQMNEQLQQLAYQEIQQNTIGLNVSNAGGTYHGLPNFFRHLQQQQQHGTTDQNHHCSSSSTLDGPQQLYQYIRNVVEQMEQYESSIQQEPLDSTTTTVSSSSSSSSSSTSSSTETSSSSLLALEPQDIECWVNVSQTNGSWNRLHTHEGSAYSGVYSGVYYVSSSSSCGSSSSSDTDEENRNDWNGNFVCKPTPHPLEDTYTLSTIEQRRLRRRCCTNNNSTLQQQQEQHRLPYIDEVQYVMIPPTPGTMILFPSYIHHCVLPLEGMNINNNNKNTMMETKHHHHSSNNAINNNNNEQRPCRISIAFNINWKRDQCN